MPKTRIQKEESVKIYTEKLQKARSVVFADYKGLNMSQMSALRNQLRDQGAEFTVTKNNLLKIALKNSMNYELPTMNLFQGPVATLFSFEDEVSPIKALVKTLKDAQVGKIKGGILDAIFMDEFSIVRLANLPSKLELRAKVVGTLAAPLSGIVGVLSANIRNLVYAVDQIRISKGGESN